MTIKSMTEKNMPQDQAKNHAEILKMLMQSNPYLKGAAKKAEELGAQHFEEATQQGGPEVANQNLQSMITQSLSGPQAQQPSQPQAQPQQGGQNTIIPAIGAFLQAIGEGGMGISPSQTAANMAKGQESKLESPSLIAQREANTALMQKQLEAMNTGKGVEKVFRDPITGQEVDPEQAQKDMEEGLGVYQVNQRITTRGGVQEKPLNKVPDLTQEEKKYVNDARILTDSLDSIKEKAKILRQKYGDASWQIFQAQKLPYAVAQDPDVQAFKSEYTYLRGRIPFLLGGKQLTPTEAKRVDALTDPFGKSEATYEKDLNRFHDEFTYGSKIMAYGVNAGLMKRLIKTDKKKKESQTKVDEDLVSKYMQKYPNRSREEIIRAMGK